ncbi:SCO family protein [Gracilibacillus marinus]|jgi:protein SCO1|uniref:SCO family protein n=1 Tax=Gracilibacillus marinus TaxID=630535 RepID=A0ABV8VW40_9BACI
MNKKLFLASLLFILLLSACGNKYEGQFSFEVNDFTYTNQDGESVSKSDLDGKFWVANMIFTECPDICPPMTANMARLQKMLSEEGLDVGLISFSVDPTNDTPEVLKDYANNYGINFDNWSFLTGYTDAEIKTFLNESFKAYVDKPEGSDTVIHQSTFYLVSPEGNAINGYNGSKAEEMNKIVEDIKSMN